METAHKLMVRGMVCNRCIRTVSEVLKNLGYSHEDIELGQVYLPVEVSDESRSRIEAALGPVGFSLVQPKDDELVSSLKKLIEEVYSGSFDFPYGFRFTELAAKRLQTDYKRLSNLFTEKAGTTPEKYILEYRIQKIKEWLVYSDESLEALSFRFGFSSTAHLSRQFKQLTGLNASCFREIRRQKQQT